MTSAAGRWGAVQVRVVQEHVGVRTDWTVRDDNHVVIAHLHGSVRDIETEVDGVGAAVAPLGADEVSLVPAGRRYRAQATGGLIRYAELRVAPDAGMHDSGVRLGHRDAFLHRSIQRLADLIARTDDVAGMAGHSVSHAAYLHVHES
ncbi:MAG TPA: hypothetical protein VNW46_01715, partial [Gemmatimonadaceae bacterium]|nr:hypothetical protein [Gemmatimonadaceae bacterium]